MATLFLNAVLLCRRAWALPPYLCLQLAPPKSFTKKPAKCEGRGYSALWYGHCCPLLPRVAGSADYILATEGGTQLAHPVEEFVHAFGSCCTVCMVGCTPHCRNDGVISSNRLHTSGQCPPAARLALNPLGPSALSCISAPGWFVWCAAAVGAPDRGLSLWRGGERTGG